jgi:dephospho-CoA kinase
MTDEGNKMNFRELARAKAAYAEEQLKDLTRSATEVKEAVVKKFGSGIANTDFYALARRVRGIEPVKRQKRQKLTKKRQRLTDEQVKALVHRGPELSPTLVSIASQLREQMRKSDISRITIDLSTKMSIARLVEEEVHL